MEKILNILMVEDDINLGYLVKENFATKGYYVHLCNDGEEGWRSFQDLEFDLILLDIMMPKRDGFSLAKMIRKNNTDVPIIFLTAKSLEEDKIEGFEIGCDDYVTKPFSARELHMRINAILKRTTSRPHKESLNSKTAIELGMYIFNYESRLLTINAETRSLSTKEADLLLVFAKNINVLINRGEILKSVWGNDDYFASKSMDVYLTRLRKLLKSDPNLEIQNVHGTGFRLMNKGAEVLK